MVRQLTFDDLLEIPPIEIVGKRIAITGTLPIKRDIVVQYLHCAGAIYATAVSGKTDFLCLGKTKKSAAEADCTKKLEVAQTLIENGGHIKIITPDDLLRAIDMADYFQSYE